MIRFTANLIMPGLASSRESAPVAAATIRPSPKRPNIRFERMSRRSGS
jgi:hypothetical protein